MIRSATAARSRWPCIRPAIRARLVFSQSCSWLAWWSRAATATIALMLSLSSATSPCASTVIDRVRSPGRDRAGHLGDRADLPGQVAGQLVHVLGQPLPGAGHALDLGLAAEPALAAHLAGHPGHLGGERGQLVDHRVDRGLQLQDLAAGVHVDLLRQVALGHRRGHLGDVADLAGQVVRHRVDVVGQVLPGPGHVRHRGLAAEDALGAHLAGHPGHLAGERAQRVDHRC